MKDVGMMIIKPIKSDSDHERALRRIQALWDAGQDTPESDELDILVALVEAYEDRRFRIEPPDPIEAIRFRLEQLGLTEHDLVPVMGSKALVDDIISRKKALDLSLIRRLNREFDISAEVLIQNYPLAL
jgi:HTH-type transcriptional regulator/antitoxin HigA